MQFWDESNDFDRALDELKRALPITALTNIVAERKRKHKAYSQYQHLLQKAVAEQIAIETVAQS